MNINDVLKDRGSRYGDFFTHAVITQQLKGIIYEYGATKLAVDQLEALEMICHKMGRILNGDPNYADSWTDIAGYAKLVADRLNTEEEPVHQKLDLTPAGTVSLR